MALESAGVSLQAQGFKEYIRNLDAIEKKNRAVFDTQFKGTAKSFAEITRLANTYEKELNDIAKAEQRAAKEAEKAARTRVKATQKAAAAQQRAAAAQSQAQRGAVGQVIGGVGGAALAGGPLGLAVAGAQAINEFRKESIELSRIQRSAEAQLAAAIQSTGGVAGLTASELKAQASALQEVTNFGDEATIAAQAQLLTFTKIGADVFPQATKSILDLATRMDGDLKGATIQVGKALNDPIAGLSALTRSGIQFNATQKELVKGFVETGQLSKAQEVILKELEIQFGGAAEAAREADGGNIALANSFGDLQEELGDVFISFGKIFSVAEKGISVIGFLQKRVETLQQVVVFAGAGFSAFGTIVSETFKRTVETGKNLVRFFSGEAIQPVKSFGQILDEAGEAAISKFTELAEFFAGPKVDPSKVIVPPEDIDESTESLKAYQSTLKQAENLQLSFARSAEDSAIKLARANKDIARKQTKSVTDLEEKQKKDRAKLLNDQQKQLDKFEKDRRKQITKAQGDIAKARKEAADKRKEDQKKLQRELKRAQESFNLSRLQSERRFSLSERRLRAEGDILAIQQLREDRELERKEEKENFGASQKDRVKSAEKQQRGQAKNLENRVGDLKSNLEDQRAELLKSFDEQFTTQQQAQTEARTAQKQGFTDAAAERVIALQREEEDRRLSQRRQLEDLGRNLADQKGVTEEGVTAIAGELEKVFGAEGVADSIFGGFKARTESDFKDLFKNVGDIVKEANIPKPTVPVPLSAGGSGSRIGGIPEFEEGGTVGGPGPIGSPQIVQAHKGETFLPTHQQTFQMAAPIIPSQSLDVNMSGGFNVTGDGQANDEILQAAAQEITENFRIAVRRLARKN